MSKAFLDSLFAHAAFRIQRHYIVSTRPDHGGAKQHCGKRQKHTSRVKARKRARSIAKRRA